MKRLATAQAGEVAADLTCGARVHEWEVGRALKASSGVLQSFAAADLQCEYPCRMPKTDASLSGGARCVLCRHVS